MGFSLKKMFSGSGWRKFKGVASIGLSVIPGVGGVAGRLLQTGVGKFGAKVLRTGQSTAQVLRASPVMPGGAVSTPGGMKAPMVNPPARFSGSSGGGPMRRKKRKATRAAPRRKGRKLKFGSKAWRAKYVKKGRRR
jgi:hypothetical protein